MVEQADTPVLETGAISVGVRLPLRVPFIVPRQTGYASLLQSDSGEFDSLGNYHFIPL